MLLFLTGDIQTGKTRWLEGVIGELARAGVPTYGVLAPGRWVPRDGGGFQKVGIDNVMLPQGERVAFAEPAQKGWAFDQDAIARVDRHLHDLGRAGEAARPGLLVIDELGWMELQKGEGLASALDLLDAGATPAFPHALVVVRESLLAAAQDRFADARWNGVQVLHPDDAARAAVLALFPQQTS